MGSEDFRIKKLKGLTKTSPVASCDSTSHSKNLTMGPSQSDYGTLAEWRERVEDRAEEREELRGESNRGLGRSVGGRRRS